MRLFNGRIRSSYQEVHLAVLDIVELLKLKCNITDKSMLFAINFVLREVMNNAVEHGNRFDESKKVSITVDLDEPNIVFVVQDEGDGFELEKTERAVDVDDILRERNRGIRTIRDLNFAVEVKQNQVWLTLDMDRYKRRPERHGEIATGQ